MTVRRYFCQIRLTAELVRHNLSLPAGEVLYRGYPLGPDETTAREMMKASFLKNSPLANPEGGNLPEIEVELEELDLCSALSARNLDLRQAERTTLESWRAQDSLAILMGRMMGEEEEGEWRHEQFPYMKGAPLDFTCRKLQTSVPDKDWQGKPTTTTVVTTVHGIFWRGSLVAAVADLYRSDEKDRPGEVLVYNRAAAFELVAEVLERRGGAPAEVDEAQPFNCFNRAGLEISREGDLVVQKTPAPSKVDYSRTRAAVDAYRATDWEVRYEDAETNEQVEAIQTEEDRMVAVVREEFAIESSHVNSADRAKLVHPNDPWLRKLIAKED